NFRVVGNQAYFRAFEPSTGWELWRSDGTSSGTKIVFDSYAGTGDSYPQPLSIINNRLVMTGTDPVYGTELMVLDDQPVTTSGIPSFDVPVDSPNSIIDLTQYFHDDVTPSNGLTYTLVNNSNPGLFSSATLDGLLGVLNLDYAAATTGEATITIRATDVANYSVTTSFTVRVGAAINDPPMNILPLGVSTPEDTATVVSGISISDTDVGSAVMRVVLSTAHGTLVLNGLTAGSINGNGSPTLTIQSTLEAINVALVSGLSYRPALDFVGADTLTIQSNDLGHTGAGGAQTDIDSVLISVSNVNDGPGIELPVGVSVAEDTAAFLTGISIQDVDNGGLINVTFTVANGTLTLNSTVIGGLLPSQITGSGSSSITVVASLTNLNTTLSDSSGLRFQPATNFNGVTSLAITANDLNLVGGALIGTDSLTINVSAVNDPPSRIAGIVESLTHYADGTAQSLGFSALQYAGGATIDEAGQALTYTLTSVPAHSLGSLVRAGDMTPLTVGTVLTLNEIRGLSFIAPQGTSGTGTIAFTVLDNGATSGVPDPRSLTESLTLSVTPRTSITLTRDINLLPANSDPTTAVNLNGVGIYTTFDYEHGTELWRSDGTSAGTYLLLDIRAGGRSSAIANLTVVGSLVFFAANDGVIGSELWKTDGTLGGTQLVSDINPGASSGSPSNLLDVNGTLFFGANNPAAGTELWKSDGTSAGTVLVKDIRPGTGFYPPGSLTNANGRLYFLSGDGTTGAELYLSDGTSIGTQLVRDIAPGISSSNVSNLRVVGSNIFFTASDGTNGNELWISDGTSSGTRMVADITPGSGSSTLGGLVVVNNLLFYSATTTSTGTELWRSDGTSSGTVMVTDIAIGTVSSSPANLFNWNGNLLFSAFSSSANTELWRSDGTSSGTVLVRDINPGTGSSAPANLIVFGDAVYFSAFSPSGGTEMWRTDGTSSGTVQVFDVFPGPSPSSPSAFVAAGNTLFFLANDGSHGSELWRTDGTSSGTFLTRDILLGTASSTILNLTASGDRVVFRAKDATIGRELWTSDGTTVGTQPILDVALGTTDALPANLVNINGIVYFAADDGARGRELWRSDGTMTGTRIVADINPGSVSSLPTYLVNVNGTLYFRATSAATGYEVWKSDGTSSGTVLVADINPGVTSSAPQNLINVNGTVFFTAAGPGTGGEIWKSDGTSSGTMLVTDLAVGTASAFAVNFAALGNQLLFTWSDPVAGRELWRTDGTSSGTGLLRDISPGTAVGFAPTPPIVMNGIAYFRAINPTSGYELWRTDGTSSGTVLVADIAAGTTSGSPANLTVVGNYLYFSAFNAAIGTELWRSDGTSSGTTLVAEINPGTFSSSPDLFRNVNGTLMFRATNATSGTELWRSDGTSSGTVLVRDISAGTTSPTLTTLTAAENALFFRAFDPINGFELWRSDGTCAGTRVVQDLFPGLGDSYPSNLLAVGDRLFFQAYDGKVGNELFVLSDNAPITTGIANRIVGLDSASLSVDLFSAFQDDINYDSQLALTVVGNSNPGLFGSVAIDGTTGQLMLTFAGAATGSSLLTVSAVDSVGQSVLTTFSVLRDGTVNTAPTLDVISDQEVDEDATIQTVTLTGISAGLGDPTQNLTITATSSNPLLVPHPIVSYTSPNSTGSLQFAPVPNASGTVTITVTVHDDGGTGNGGVDTFVRTFTVTVNSVNDAPINRVPAVLTTAEDSPLSVGSSLAVSDVDAGTAPLQVILSANGGSIVLGSQTAASLTLIDSVASLNTTLQGLYFVPTSNFNGTAFITMVTDDRGNSG
ncbi:MAG: hypothetical protein JNM18_07460, partial [Planctomycetaceae bacterium]|nr:hypothetical protein [Planctomycetaceae bacterium]